MTAKKPRKSLGDTLANNFVYGDKAPLPAAEPVVEQVEPIAQAHEAVVKTVETVVYLAEPTLHEQVEPLVKAVATAETSAPISPQPPTSLMSRLMQNTPEKEPTVRLTVDLPQSTHKKLSILCANTGMKKVEVVRMLLDDALKDTNT
jgi:hypothetical protein